MPETVPAGGGVEAVGPRRDCGEVGFRLDIRRIFTPVPASISYPVLAAGGWLAHIPEPRSKSLKAY